MNSASIHRNLTAAAAIADTIITELAAAANDPTIGANQLHLLLHIYVNGNIYQSEASKFSGRAKSTNSRLIARLGRGDLSGPGLGWIEPVEDLKNRRMNMVMLTQRGRAAIEAACERASGFYPKHQ